MISRNKITSGSVHIRFFEWSKFDNFIKCQLIDILNRFESIAHNCNVETHWVDMMNPVGSRPEFDLSDDLALNLSRRLSDDNCRGRDNMSDDVTVCISSAWDKSNIGVDLIRGYRYHISNDLFIVNLNLPPFHVAENLYSKKCIDDFTKFNQSACVTFLSLIGLHSLCDEKKITSVQFYRNSVEEVEIKRKRDPIFGYEEPAVGLYVNPLDVARKIDFG